MVPTSARRPQRPRSRRHQVEVDALSSSPSIPPAMAPKPTVCLDYTAYPHIFDSILLHASYSVLLSLRSTSHAIQNRVDAHLARHVLLSIAPGRHLWDAPVVPTALLPPPSATSYSSKPTALAYTPRRLPAFYGWCAHPPPAPSALPSYAPLWSRTLSATRVLDVCGDIPGPPSPSTLGATHEASARTLRLRADTHGSAPYSLVTPHATHTAVAFPPPADPYGVPGTLVHAVRIGGAGAISRVVVHAAVGRTGARAILPRGAGGMSEVVLVLQDGDGDGTVHGIGGAGDGMADIPFGHARLSRVLGTALRPFLAHLGIALKRGAALAVVGAERLKPECLGEPTNKSSDDDETEGGETREKDERRRRIVRSLVAAAQEGNEGWTEAMLEDLSERVQVLTVEEYRVSISHDQFMREMVP